MVGAATYDKSASGAHVDPASAIASEMRRFFAPNQVIELRAPKTRHGTVSGYFDEPEKFAAAAAQLSGQVPGVYFTPNPAVPALLARANNRIVMRAAQMTSDHDIVRLCWLQIDNDPIRPAGISATDAEHEAALARTQALAAWLLRRGFQDLVVADSGNGGHCMVPIALPNDVTSTALLKRCLEALSLYFTDEQVAVDLTTYNPARIWKVYGTLACKGDSTPDRPHRLARVLEAPDQFAPNPRELLAQLAALAPEEPPRQHARSTSRGTGTFDLEQWIAKHNLAVIGPHSWQSGRKWIFRVCPWNADHTNSAAFIVQLANGAIAAGCHHNGCAGKKWHDLRDTIEPGWREWWNNGKSQEYADDYSVDPLAYLEEKCGGELSPGECLEHYQVLKPSLLRLRSVDLAAFDIAVKEIVKKLGIKAKTIRDDLAGFAEPPAAKEARALLDKINQTSLLRLAQDYQDGKLWFGVIAGEDKLLVNSDRELLTLDKVPDGFIVKDSGFDLCRFSKDSIVRFLSGAEESGSELLADLRAFFLRFAVFRGKRLALLLAVWALGTYCYRTFRVFSYLALRSPDKRCGKSRVLDLLSLLAFNASPRVTNPTEAQIFRGPSRNGGTLLLDEIEALGKSDKENYAGLLSALNSGFECGGSVSRLEKNGAGSFHEVSFETYCPRAIAGINKTTETLEDRSIIIVMQRKLAREKTERFSPSRLEDEAQALRDRCYVWALTHAADLAETYDKADKLFPALDSLDDRARDLWEPLVSITAVTDVERGDDKNTLTDELTALACDLCQVRDGAAEDSTVVQVVNALRSILAQKRSTGLFQENEAVKITPTELATGLKDKLGWEKLSTKTLATLLNPLGLFSKSTKEHGHVIKAYHLHEPNITELQERYAQDNTAKDEKK